MMKLLLLSFLLTTSLWARQYIQCADADGSSLVSVVNLPSQDAGSFFISSGMENDENERLLCPIAFKNFENNQVVYSFSGNCEGEISFHQDLLGKVTNYLPLHVSLNGIMANMICFSRIYQD
jgi:hypothetical protein